MKRIEFHDRGREIKEITNILDSEPTLITFVYGPMNSVKTTLINHLIGQLSEEYVPFYINLRGRFIRLVAKQHPPQESCTLPSRTAPSIQQNFR